MIQTDMLPGIDVPTVSDVETGSGFLQSLKGLGFEDAMSTIANAIVQFSFRLCIAILVFYIGKFIIRKLYNFVFGIMVNRKVDASLTTFVLSLVRMVLYFILIITVIGIIGIETSSFLALFASAGVAIGMALSGTLQNFAGGVLILLLKPYKVGDYIEAQGFAGTVKEVQIFSTIITTPDNKSIIIPNGGLSTGSINNYSREEYRRVDWKIGLSYGTDFAAAKTVILQMLNEDNRVVKTNIDDDKAFRRELKKEEELKREEELKKLDSLNQDNNPGQAGDNKPGWWKRFKVRREEKQRILHDKLLEQTAIKEGLPTKQNGAPPFVELGELADSSINITIRVWTHSSNYWPLFFEMNRRFYTELPQHGFSFPFPQMDVHLVNEQ
ncbi:MAG: mechanosensitive ion channel [Muribaculaceae bacterium]|nr:mechanosensitive ion channel [Muribaculaceae bacterium]